MFNLPRITNPLSILGSGARRWFGAMVAVFALASVSAVLAVTAGSLDASFGVAGKTLTPFANPAQASAMAVQADGKFVVVGGPDRFNVARYNPNGSLDTSFANFGKFSLSMGSQLNYADSVAIQADGKIAVAGFSRWGNTDHGMVVMRLNANGTLDNTFAGDGIASVDFMFSAVANVVAIQPNGSILVGGSAIFGEFPANTDFALVRFTSAGVLDTSFGGVGYVAVNHGRYETINALALLPDGRILAGGLADTGVIGGPYGDSDFMMARFNANGTFDNTFGTNGVVVMAIGGSLDVISALALQPDGKIIAAGTVVSDTLDLAIIRFTSSGQLDVGNFGSGGKVVVDFSGHEDQAYAVAIDPAGYIVASGGGSLYAGNAESDAIFVRCEPDGDLDPNFGTNGKAVVNFGPGSGEHAYGMALQPTLLRNVVNGYKIVAAGDLATYGSFGILRLHGKSGPINRAVVNDFDNDGLSELAAFRPQNGNWIIGKVPPTGTVTEVTTIQWGAANDKVVPGDYDGDGKYDVAVYRRGQWHILNSGDVSYRTVAFGLPTDIPVPADYDADGRTDVAVFRPSEGAWYILRSSDGTASASPWGANGDIPVTGDFDRDDVADLAVYRGGVWYILQSLTGQMRVEYFGLPTDKPVAFDYDGDSKTDIGVFRAGDWYYVASDTNTFTYFHWGQSSDVPLPGRYGTPTGLAFNHGGQWWLLGRDIVWLTGPSGDIPVPTYFAQ